MQAVPAGLGGAGEGLAISAIVADSNTAYLSCAQGYSVVALHDISLDARVNSSFYLLVT